MEDKDEGISSLLARTRSGAVDNWNIFNRIVCLCVRGDVAFPTSVERVSNKCYQGQSCLRASHDQACWK